LAFRAWISSPDADLSFSGNERARFRNGGAGRFALRAIYQKVEWSHFAAAQSSVGRAAFALPNRKETETISTADPQERFLPSGIR
jgi:hypothetical protein